MQQMSETWPSGRQKPYSPAPVSSFPAGALPAYVSNGFMGLRSQWQPCEIGVAILNGFAGQDPVTQVASFARAPFPLAFDLTIDGMRLSEEVGRCRLREQRYDFSTGELSTDVEVLSGERRVNVRQLVFCSRAAPALCVQELEVRVDGPCDLELSVGVDPTGIPGRWDERAAAPEGGIVDGVLLWRSLGDLGICGVAYSS